MHSFVTGAASGIGAATALRLAQHGPVALADKDADGLVATARAVSAAGGSATSHVLDVTDAADVAAALDAAERARGPVDALAHCAGILVAGPVLETPDADWSAAIAVNLTGTVTVLTAAARRMAARGAGAAVVVGSNAGNGPRVGLGAYGASKAAAHNASLTLALELAGSGVRINVVAPGSTATPMQTAFGGEAAADAAVVGDLSRHRLGIPLGRIADPEDIAGAIDYLLSPAARHVTAQVLTVDGGATV
ncbi:SDR family oxidoreductase [Tsukamurella sp. 1534]|uniref:SDR family oxidoreductase n=1 Tax=Tsukamurella sp. 1534 TaxID=1151061 RepID=UPI00031D0C00|nr:SDR family oxidoreductase [Tsukamurella sp. 1534]